MKAQYNFKIEDELKKELDTIQQESGVVGKEEFLQELLTGYKHCKANQVDTEIDLSKYETVSKQTKTVVFDAFKHILSTIEANSTNNKQQALALEKDTLLIVEERKVFNEQIDQLTANHNQKLLDIDKANKEQLKIKDDDIAKVKSDMQSMEDSKDILSTQLSDIKKELSQVQAIAEQAQSVSVANKELRDELSQLTANHNQKLLDIDKQNKEQLKLKDDDIDKAKSEIDELRQYKFKNELITSNKDEELKKVKEQLEQLKEVEKQNTILETKLEMLTESKQ